MDGLDQSHAADRQQIWVLKPTLHATTPAALISMLRFQKPLPGQSTEKMELRRDGMYQGLMWMKPREGAPKAWFRATPCPSPSHVLPRELVQTGSLLFRQEHGQDAHVRGEGRSWKHKATWTGPSPGPEEGRQ